MSDGTQHASPAEGSPVRRRHGRRARQLSPEEQAALDARRAELEASGVIPVVPDEPEQTGTPDADPAAAQAETAAHPDAGTSGTIPEEAAGPTGRQDERSERTTDIEAPLPPFAPWADDNRRGGRPNRFPFLSGRPADGSPSSPAPAEETAVVPPIRDHSPASADETMAMPPIRDHSSASADETTVMPPIRDHSPSTAVEDDDVADGQGADWTRAPETEAAASSDDDAIARAAAALDGAHGSTEDDRAPQSETIPAPTTPAPTQAQPDGTTPSGHAAPAGPASTPTLRDVQRPPAGSPTPTVRRLGRRARIVEVEESGTGPTAPETSEQHGAPAITRDSDGVELGELAVGDAPGPRPAPRFEGRVLHRPERSGGNPVVWMVWALVALALIALVALLLTGVIGPGIAGALGALPPTPDASTASSPLTT